MQIIQHAQAVLLAVELVDIGVLEIIIVIILQVLVLLQLLVQQVIMQVVKILLAVQMQAENSALAELTQILTVTQLVQPALQAMDHLVETEYAIKEKEQKAEIQTCALETVVVHLNHALQDIIGALVQIRVLQIQVLATVQ